MFRFLFVCTGNICRSPTAEGVFRHMAAQARMDLIETDSVGIAGGPVGDPPDRRSVQAAARRGIDISGLRARQLTSADFDDFDLLLAMDQGHLREMEGLAPPEHTHKVCLFMAEARGFKAPDVPDPYYGGASGFDDVLDMIEEGAEAWLGSHQARGP